MLLLCLIPPAFVDAGDLSPQTPPAPNTSLDARLREIEQQNAAFTEQLRRLEAENAALKDRWGADLAGGHSRTLGVELTDYEQPSDIATDEAPTGQSSAARNPDVTKSFFDEGFKWKSADGEFDLQFHNETQLDMRAYSEGHSDPTNQFGFYIPRARMIFNGHLTQPIEYNISINKGLGSLDLLDAYFNFNYDERVQLRVGRYRAPFTYDWYALSNQFLLTPERSLFALNYGFNRNFAVMLHGELRDGEVDYAVAAANGPRNSYFDNSADKDVLAYLNLRPFRHTDLVPLRHLNIGGSVDYGLQDQDPLPVDFRTSANATESAGTVEAVPSFLELEPNVVERGYRTQGELHAAWYYKQWSVLGAWDRAVNTYAFTDKGGRVHLPARGWHVQAGYFLTGEEVERRTFVEPRRPFDLRTGRRGLGAIELQTRLDHFAVGSEVFRGGLADPALWTNRVTAIDSGINWYLNKYVKIDFDWQRSMYGQPVVFKPGGSTRKSDLFWVRFQVYF